MFQGLSLNATVTLCHPLPPTSPKIPHRAATFQLDSHTLSEFTYESHWQIVGNCSEGESCRPHRVSLYHATGTGVSPLQVFAFACQFNVPLSHLIKIMEKKSNTNSLDWDSPSTKTGTVKRRPVSGLSDASSGSESRKKSGASECEKNAENSSVNSDCVCFAKESMDFIVRAFDCKSAVNVDNTGNFVRCRDIETWNSDINAKETFVTECLEKLRKYEHKYSDHVSPDNHESIRDRKIRNSDSATVKSNRNMTDSKIRNAQLVVRNEPKVEHRLRNSVPSASRDSSNSRIRNSVPSEFRNLKVRDYPREHSSGGRKVPRTTESNIPDLIGAATRICEARTVCLANGRPRSGPSKHVPREPETLSRSSVLQENYATLSTANGSSKRSRQVTQDIDKCLQQRHTQGTKSNHCNCDICTPSILVPVSLKNGKMSDSDSGIASPLSPLSIYAYTDVFFTKCDGNNEEATWRHLEQLRNCTCLTDQQQCFIGRYESVKPVIELVTNDQRAGGNITGHWIELLLCKIERAKYGLPFGLPVLAMGGCGK
ncbi:hypothetical protein CBL_12663 [Carabus blaptoides fortunei]